MGKVMLEVRNLKTKYVTRFHEDVYAVDGVSFKIEEGKSLGIAGESGCGKSTLALSMMGYYFPPLHYMSGDIVIDGRNISGMKPRHGNCLNSPSCHERPEPNPENHPLYRGRGAGT